MRSPRGPCARLPKLSSGRRSGTHRRAFAFRTAATLLAVYLAEAGFVKLGRQPLPAVPHLQHFFGGRETSARRAVPRAKPAFGPSASGDRGEGRAHDLVFAIHSILVGSDVAKPWVISRRILGIVMMRLVIGTLLSMSNGTRRWSTARRDHRMGRREALIELPACRGYLAFRVPEVGIARPHRGDLQRGLPLCARESAPRRDAGGAARQGPADRGGALLRLFRREQSGTGLPWPDRGARRADAASAWWLSRYAVSVRRLRRGVAIPSSIGRGVNRGSVSTSSATTWRSRTSRRTSSMRVAVEDYRSITTRHRPIVRAAPSFAPPAGGRVEGGSTLTQQLARSCFSPTSGVRAEVRKRHRDPD